MNKEDKTEKDNMPDFDSLDDRLIAGPPSGPMIGIKTNMDRNPEEFDPYQKEENSSANKKS